ncbi:hypothetical protein G4B88_010351 [Cannabis sativa]|uniref:Small nuclear ribonucleoprotein G n=1 Tax=Cannabis sativa TaxID=3483 RepID=A0A7J6I7B6_CANSA|nr:hypothetical protein G4B88_010351 [Cannabis sativa]
MSRSGQPPDLKKYMDKKLQIKLNANRMVVGTLRGFDQFMNLVVDNTVEVNGNENNDIGMVVRYTTTPFPFPAFILVLYFESDELAVNSYLACLQSQSLNVIDVFLNELCFKALLI